MAFPSILSRWKGNFSSHSLSKITLSLSMTL
jgi:hypothetical protein